MCLILWNILGSIGWKPFYFFWKAIKIKGSAQKQKKVRSGSGNTGIFCLGLVMLWGSPYCWRTFRTRRDTLQKFMPNELIKQYEPPHNKTNKMNMRPTNTQISLGIRPVWSESSLSQSAWRRLGSLAIHWVHCKDSDQTVGFAILLENIPYKEGYIAEIHA